MDILIYIRHLQMFDIFGTPIIYTGPNPQSLVATPGNVPVTTWQDVSNDVSNRDKLKITFTLGRDIHGASVPGAFKPKKAVSGSIQIEGDAYQFIRAWC